MARIWGRPQNLGLLDGRYVNVTGDTMTGALNTLNVIPTLDSNSNLGSTTVAWANLYVDTISSITGNALALTPVSGQSLTVNLATTGDFIVNTVDLVIDTSTDRVGIGTASPGSILHLLSGEPSVIRQTIESTNNGQQVSLKLTGKDSGGTARSAEISIGAFADNAFSISNGTTEYHRLTLSTGVALFKNGTNSTIGFQVQQSDGTIVLDVDTTNARVGIGTDSPTQLLSIGANIHLFSVTAGGEVVINETGVDINFRGESDDATDLWFFDAGADTGAGSIGFFSVTPQVQQATIADADGTLADITTKFNTLLADLEGYGLLKSV